MGLFARGKDVPRSSVAMQVLGGSLSTQQVVGKSASLMVARRSAGYHSKPHVHDCEQLNYVTEGEIWIFLQDQGFHLQTGDFLRIPAGAVHWAWNRSQQECELIECHAPPLDVLPRDQSVPLLADEEREDEIPWVENQFVSDQYLDVEKKLLG